MTNNEFGERKQGNYFWEQGICPIVPKGRGRHSARQHLDGHSPPYSSSAMRIYSERGPLSPPLPWPITASLAQPCHCSLPISRGAAVHDIGRAKGEVECKNDNASQSGVLPSPLLRRSLGWRIWWGAWVGEAADPNGEVSRKAFAFPVDGRTAYRTENERSGRCRSRRSVSTS